MTRVAETLSQPSSEATPTAPVGVSLLGIGVLGATGYAGQELVRLLSGHPRVRLAALGSRQQAGQSAAAAFPWLGDPASLPGAGLPEALEDDATDPVAWKARGIDVVFSALPHGAFAARAAAFRTAGISVIDLAADFRPGAADEWTARQGGAHPAPELIEDALYGLTEWVDWEAVLAAGRPAFVANPGCYATAILLAALPVVADGLWSGAPIVATALSGVSGAGRGPSLTTHFVECGQGVAPYRVGEAHQHRTEILALLERQSPAGVGVGPLIMNPHLVPMARGIAATVTIPLDRPLDEAAARALFAARYSGTPFVRLLGGPALPETRHVRGSNRCDIAFRIVAGGTMLLVMSALDNLVKGAAGQAVQNLNRLMGWPEVAGLPQEAWPCA